MRSLNGVLFRFLVLALIFVFFSSPIFAGDENKAVKEQKTVKAVKKLVNPNRLKQKKLQRAMLPLVNGVAITQDDFDRELMGVEEQSANRGEKLDEARLSEIKKRILEKLDRRRTSLSGKPENGD